MTSTPTTLADRVESADGASRELDAEIAFLALGYKVVHHGHPIGTACYDARGNAVDLPRYTASLDAALTLVPEGFRCHLNIAEDGITTAIVNGWQGVGNAPALALCAAALRARQATPNA